MFSFTFGNKKENASNISGNTVIMSLKNKSKGTTFDYHTYFDFGECFNVS